MESGRMKTSKKNMRLAGLPGGGAGRTPYPKYDVTNREKWTYDWDEKTRRLVKDRVENVPGCQFFSKAEAALLEALCAQILPQADRARNDRVPIVPWIDQRLQQGKTAGYRYERMPADPQAYRLGLQGFNQAAENIFGRTFLDLQPQQQMNIIQRVAEGHPPGDVWRQVPADLFFQMMVSDIITEYYAHPAAWAEIGFNGPASPRGHIRLKLDQRDDWEAEEARPHSSVEIVQKQLQSGKTSRGEAKGGPTH